MHGSSTRWLQVRTCASTIPAALLLTGVLLASGCASRGLPERVEPGVEQRAIEAVSPRHHRLVIFDWSLREGQSRFSGAGAARIAPDFRARLDLFGPQDVPYLSAVLRGERLLLPAGIPARVVPPAPLLWSALGVVRPPDGAALRTAIRDGQSTVLVYAGELGRWTFRIRDAALTHAEWVSSDGARHTVELSGSAQGAPPGRAVYRDWQEFRELVLELQEHEEVDGFPLETWSLDAR